MIAFGSPLARNLAIALTGALFMALSFLAPASAHAAFEILKFEAHATGPLEEPFTQAGGHPFELVTEFETSTKTDNLGKVVPDGSMRDVYATPPPGLLANPQVAAPCSEEELSTDTCPTDSQVGTVEVFATDESSTGEYPLYNMAPPPGAPAELGFSIDGVAWVHLIARVRPNGTVFLASEGISQLVPVIATTVRVWGYPADPAHDPKRICRPSGKLGCAHGPGLREEAFLSLPTSCAGPQPWALAADSWPDPGIFVEKEFLQPANTGCEDVEFAPAIEARPTTEATDSPSGLELALRVPQDQDPGHTASAHLRDSAIALPPGFVVNPASANGLGACSPAQVGIDPQSGEPDSSEPTCPDASKLGDLEVDTPLLDHPVGGAAYLAQPFENPFGSLIAVYLVLDSPEDGILVKIAARAEPDPASGQITATVTDAPQLPFEELRVRFKRGPGAPLRTPATCGPHTTASSLTPWSAPASGPPASPTDSFSLPAAAGGGACAATPGELPHAPALEAGTLSPQAATYSPFALRLARPDGSQELDSLTVSPPPGLSAKLAGVPYCPEAALAAAAGRSGAAERSSPSCPQASRIGSVIAGAGAGPAPFYAPGTAYLSGPYKGAPLSIAVLTPALAGPFDLGTILVRSALYVDEATGRATVATDPIPRLLEGIPLDVRSIRVDLDRPGFTLNPTDCDPLAVTGTATSVLGQAAQIQAPFQAQGCAALGFGPKLTLSLKGPTGRSGHPALHSTLRPRAGDANLAGAVVTLPPSEFIDNAHISNPCTRVQFAAERCPKGSILGTAKATSPLLDAPLEGKVYFRSNGGERELPDIVADLRGQIRIVAVGFVDSRKGRVRTTFATVPDAPVSKIQIDLFGGKRGLLVNNRNLCARKLRAKAKLTAANGRVREARPVVGTSCAKKPKRSRR